MENIGIDVGPKGDIQLCSLLAYCRKKTEESNASPRKQYRDTVITLLWLDGLLQGTL